jgi:protein-disulfide isomerase
MAAVEGAQPLTRFTEVIDALLAGKEPPAEPAPERAPLPLWATPRGLAPDPARPGYDVAGDAYKGSPQAKVFVVEFTDFQCPACRKHATEVQPALDAEWVKSGRVLWVSKHLPLRMHAQAVLAAVAAECAGEQGRYWEMHDRLFAHQDDWSGASAETSLPGLARQLGLDPQRFQQCFDGRKALERVLADLYDAQAIVDRVPTFVVLTGGPTGTATGPLPAEGFGKLLQQAQSEAQAAAAAAKAPPDPKH